MTPSENFLSVAIGKPAGNQRPVAICAPNVYSFLRSLAEAHVNEPPSCGVIQDISFREFGAGSANLHDVGSVDMGRVDVVR